MDIESILKEVIESDENEVEDEFFSVFLKNWVYFYFFETDGRDTKPGNENVDVVIFTGKDNPINVPTINNELGNNGVIYTNRELAIRLAEFDCKVGKMRGRKALSMFRSILSISGIYIQGNNGNIHLNSAKMSQVLNKNA